MNVQQDWTPVVWNKKAPTGAKASDAHVVNEARRMGKDIEVEKRRTAGNSSLSHQISNAKKLEEETESFHLPHVSHEFRLALQKVRQGKGMTQQQLATLISEKVTVINDYESGKAIPNGAIISKLNKALDVTLPKARENRK
jgi:putative transcription factor